MDVKLEIPGLNSDDPSPLSYKPIPEKDMEEAALARPKSLLIGTGNSIDLDDAKEKMLPNQNYNDEFTKISQDKTRQNGDTKFDIGNEDISCFGGLTKEELMKFAVDPFWIRVRWFLFIVFWMLWIAMLLGAIAIIYAAPKCDPPPPRTWWEKGLISMVSQDAPADAIKQSDSHIRGLIIHWPDDIYSSSLTPAQENAMNLIQAAKDDNRNVILDIDPTSSNVWFEKSENRVPEFSDFYIWKAGIDNREIGEKLRISPPNNWVRRNNTSSWTYSTIRNEYYYSPFNGPHLNFRNRKVVQAFNKILEKFLTMNISGISLRNAALLLTDSQFENEMVINSKINNVDHEQYDFYKHTKTENLPEIVELLNEWREIVKEKTNNEGPFLIAEELEKVDSYKINDSLIIDMPFKSNVFFKTVNDTLNNLKYTFTIDNIQWPLWDLRRTDLKISSNNVLNIAAYLLPGVPLINLNDTVDCTLIKIRESPSIMRGNCELYGLQNNTVFSFIRQREMAGSPGVLVAVNLNNQTSTVNVPIEIPSLAKLQEVTVRYYSETYNETSFMDIGIKRNATAVPISPKSAIVLEYVPNHNE